MNTPISKLSLYDGVIGAAVRARYAQVQWPLILRTPETDGDMCNSPVHNVASSRLVSGWLVGCVGEDTISHSSPVDQPSVRQTQ